MPCCRGMLSQKVAVHAKWTVSCHFHQMDTNSSRSQKTFWNYAIHLSNWDNVFQNNIKYIFITVSGELVPYLFIGWRCYNKDWNNHYSKHHSWSSSDCPDKLLTKMCIFKFKSAKVIKENHSFCQCVCELVKCHELI